MPGPGLYLAPLNQPFNVFPGFAFVRNTDPAVTWPTLVQPGMPWMKTNADEAWTSILGIFVRNLSNDGWVAAAPGGEGTSGDFEPRARPIRLASGSTTLTEADGTIVVDASGGAAVVTLPPAADVDGQIFAVFNLDGANTVTLEPDGAEEIGGAANRVLNSALEGTFFQADGNRNHWLILARPGSGSPPEGSAGGDLTGSYPNPTIKDDVALGGNPTTTTQALGNNSTRIATTAFVQAALAAMVDAAPSTLDTLNELAAALGDDPNFAASVAADLGDHETRISALESQVPAVVESEGGGTYTYVLADAGKYKRFTNAAGCSATIPANASVAFPVGTELHGLGTQDQVTLVADTGVTINTPETLKTAKAFAAFTAKKVGTNEWDLMGYLEVAP